MPINWPATLPQQPSEFSAKPHPVTLRTEMDSGPSKSRRRFTKAKKTAQMGFLLTIAQWQILDAFYETTLKGGSLSMNFTHPWLGTTKEMWITEPPSSSADGPLGVRVQFPVEFY